jgi:hypothetical protein
MVGDEPRLRGAILVKRLEPMTTIGRQLRCATAPIALEPQPDDLEDGQLAADYGTVSIRRTTVSTGP